MKKFIKPIAAAAAVLLLLITFTAGYVANLKSGISSSILRLHIVGASDSEYDQTLKLCVRDRILSDYSSDFAQCKSSADAENIAKSLLNEIESSAENELSARGCNTEVTAMVEECRFPTKSYGTITLPGGRYTALNIKIGSAEGQNWWCVMYPPLCITDKSIVMPESSMKALKESLSAEEYQLICENKQPDIKIKFRIAEILGKYFR